MGREKKMVGVMRRTRVVRGARAKLTGNNWLPGSKRPEHLDGSRPGDVGFDPLGLSKDPSSAERLREAEIIHGRYAMLGAAGCLAVELAGQGTWVMRQNGHSPARRQPTLGSKFPSACRWFSSSK